MAQSNSKITLIGGKNSIRRQLTKFQEKYDVEEIMAVSYILIVTNKSGHMKF